MKYGDVIEEIKRLLSENAIPHFICDECASIVIADSKELLNRDGKGLMMDKNDSRFRSLSREILGSLENKHKQLHSMPDDEYARKRQMELVEYGEALETILKLAGKYNVGGEELCYKKLNIKLFIQPLLHIKKMLYLLYDNVIFL